MANFVYVDNSTIWIEGVRVSAVVKGPHGLVTLPFTKKSRRSTLRLGRFPMRLFAQFSLGLCHPDFARNRNQSGKRAVPLDEPSGTLHNSRKSGSVTRESASPRPHRSSKVRVGALKNRGKSQ